MPVEEQPVTKRSKIVEEGSPPEESVNVPQELVAELPQDNQQEPEGVVDAAEAVRLNGVGLGAEHSTAAAQDRQQLRREGMRRLRALMEGRSEEFRRGIVALLRSLLRK
ncbi:hypothetical protein CAEBREN_03482 [Caenorhabditis brenneri]|uniref:Uncharacterized protein n=1 Tax=Caenorhabditis brenneri TaxID=135651 RepID=G0PCY8_CAEBE|nr:hypothetical protein CAEBREN_03482 [Caenorhabditis brenneri]